MGELVDIGFERSADFSTDDEEGMGLTFAGPGASDPNLAKAEGTTVEPREEDLQFAPGDEVEEVVPRTDAV